MSTEQNAKYKPISSLTYLEHCTGRSNTREHVHVGSDAEPDEVSAARYA